MWDISAKFYFLQHSNQEYLVKCAYSGIYTKLYYVASCMFQSEKSSEWRQNSVRFYVKQMNMNVATFWLLYIIPMTHDNFSFYVSWKK